MSSNFLETEFHARREIRLTEDIDLWRESGNSLYMKYLSDLDDEFKPCWLTGKPKRYVEVTSSTEFVLYIDTALLPKYETRWKCSLYKDLLSSLEDRRQLETDQAISLRMMTNRQLENFNSRRERFFDIWGHYPDYWVTKL